jgi:hypothetical protein
MGGSENIASLIHNLGTGWRWVVCFTPWSLYSRRRRSRYPLGRRLGEHQGRSARCEEGNNLLPLSEIEPRFLGRPARRLVAWYWLWLWILFLSYKIITWPNYRLLKYFVEMTAPASIYEYVQWSDTDLWIWIRQYDKYSHNLFYAVSEISVGQWWLDLMLGYPFAFYGTTSPYRRLTPYLRIVNADDAAFSRTTGFPTYYICALRTATYRFLYSRNLSEVL